MASNCTFIVWREPLSTGSVKTALADFQRLFQRMPGELVVNRKNEQQANEIAREIGLLLPVGTSGGCLVGELWLRDDGLQHASLI